MADVCYGAVLKTSDGVSGALVAWDGLVSVTAPALEQQFSEITVMSSPDRIREYKASLREPGTMSFVVRYTAANEARADLLFGVTRDWELVYNDGGTSSWSGAVSKFGSDLGDASQTQDLKVDVKVLGDVEFEA